MHILPAILPLALSLISAGCARNKTENKKNIPENTYVLVAESFKTGKNNRISPNYNGGGHDFAVTTDKTKTTCSSAEIPIKKIRKVDVNCGFFTGGLFLCSIYYTPTASPDIFKNQMTVCINPDLIAYILSDEEAAKLLNPNP